MFTQEQISRLLDIGNTACHAGAVYEARQIFDGVLALRPENAPALIGKALSHIVVDDFTAAEDLLKDKVLAKDPNHAEAVAMLGLCYLLGGKREEARVELERIKAQDSPAGKLARELLAV